MKRPPPNQSHQRSTGKDKAAVAIQPFLFHMKKQLRLVENGQTFYVPTLDDYNICCEMRVPLTKISRNMLPLLKARCKKQQIQLKVYPFSKVESVKYKKIKKKWEYGFEVDGDSIHIEIPKKRSIYEQAQILVDAVCGFYTRHLYDVEVTSRKFPSKFRFTIERTFNDGKEPVWKS